MANPTPQLRTGKQRNTGLDLLRLLATCMVIVLHYNNSKMGGILGSLTLHETNYFVAQATEIVSIIACNLFVLISAYYLSAASRAKVRKVVDIGLMLLFYGLVCLAVAYAVGAAPTEATFDDFLRSILNRWFVDIYVILYLLFPFLNRLIQQLSRKKHLLLIWIFFIFFSIWPSVYTTITVSDHGYGITNFLLLYLIAAYVRRYLDDLKRPKTLIALYLVSVALTYLIRCYPALVGSEWKARLDVIFKGKALWYNFSLNVVSSVLLFLIFKNLPLRQSRALAKLSGYSLSVYVIHENIFMQQFLFRTVFHTPDYYHRPMMFPHLIATTVGIFVLCVLAECIRRLIFRYTVDPLLSRARWANRTYTG